MQTEFPKLAGLARTLTPELGLSLLLHAASRGWTQGWAEFPAFPDGHQGEGCVVAQYTQQMCSRNSWDKSRPEVEDVAGRLLGERLLQIDQGRTDLPFKGAWALHFLSFLHPAQLWAAAVGPGLVRGLLGAHTLSLPPRFPDDQEEHPPVGRMADTAQEGI